MASDMHHGSSTEDLSNFEHNGWMLQDDSNFSLTSSSALSTPLQRRSGKKGAKKRKLSLDSMDSNQSENVLKKSRLARTLLEDGKHGVIDGRWVCGECGKSLSSASGLDQHLSTVHGEYQFPCTFCPLKFKRKDHVANHIRRVHECVKKCGKCNNREFIGRESYAEHMKAVHKIKLTFRTTRKDNDNPLKAVNSSPLKKTLRSSISPVVKSPTKTPKLKDDPNVSPGKRKLGRPRKLGLNTPEKTDQSPEMMPPPSGSPTKYMLSHECKYCLKRFHNEMILYRHKMNAHRDEMVMLPCTLCRRFFSGVTCLHRHKDLHHKADHEDFSVVKCSYCPGVFHEASSLEDHVKFFHQEEECLLCGSVFNGAFEMYEHISEIHPPYQAHQHAHVCTLCGAYYPYRHHAIEHFRRRHVFHWNYISLPKQVYSCPHCQIPFDSWTQMDSHVIQVL